MERKTDSFVDQVLKKTNIIELINEVTTLEKRGNSHFGLCPFHDEKTASFSVSEDKQLYHCFSCKASGNALTFIKETQGLSSEAAIKQLAERVNMKYTPTQSKQSHHKYYEINTEALNFYKVVLHHTKEGNDALDYLLKRNLSKQTIETFDIGFAPAKADALYQALRQKEILHTDLVDLALIKDETPPYDFFRNRIMFSIHNHDGEVIGFSGRIHHASDQAKYINSQGTVIFEKNKVLYNLHRAKKPIKEKDRVIIFEGFMDVIAAHQAGLKESIALMGTALTAHHIQILKKHTNNVILAFDSDDAGLQATIKFLEVLKTASFDVQIVTLETGLDPDDYIRKYGEKQFITQIENATSQEDFLYAHYKKDTNFKKIMDVEQLKKRVFDMIKSLSYNIQMHYIQQLANDASMRVDILEEDFRQSVKPEKPTYQKIAKVDITDKFRRAERGFMHYFLKSEHYARRFRSEFEDVTYIDKHARDIQFEIFEFYDLNRHSCIVPELFFKHLSPTLQHYYETHIHYLDYPFQEKEFDDFMQVMREYNRRNKINALKRQMQQAPSNEEKIRIKESIDKIIKEANHGKRKNYSRTH